MSIDVKYRDIVHDKQGNLVAGIFLYNEDDQNFCIKINTMENRKHEDVVATLLHEIGHCVIYRLGLHNTNLDNNLEEVIVDGIATVLSENFEFKL